MYTLKCNTITLSDMCAMTSTSQQQVLAIMVEAVYILLLHHDTPPGMMYKYNDFNFQFLKYKYKYNVLILVRITYYF